MTGPVYRTPTDSYTSPLDTARKGIAAVLSFRGAGSSYNGNTLAQAVFFHDEPCTRASTEYGFFRYVRGLATDDTVYFYYELNANCAPEGKCRVRGTDQILIDQQDAVALPKQPANNSKGRNEWLYTAYFINAGAQWCIRVVDPYTFADTFPPLLRDVKDFFHQTAAEYFMMGANGYVTATATRNGPVGYVGEVPTMDVGEISVAK